MEIVLEVGPANGDIGYAMECVDRAAKLRDTLDVSLKGQLYHREQLVTRSAETYAQEGIAVPDTQWEDFEKTLTYDEWADVYDYAQDMSVPMFFSVFDYGAVHFCEAIGVTRYKIASGDITYHQLISKVAETGKEVVLSTGAATEREVEQAVKVAGEVTVLLACSLSYPTRPSDANVSRMTTLRKYSDRVGYSDHTFGLGALHRAAHHGAVMVEKHFTLTPGEGGDHDFAITHAQLAGVLEWSPGIPTYDGSPELAPSQAELKARVGARRSLVAGRDLQQGNLLRENDVKMLRPGTGIEPYRMDEYVGRPLRVDVPAGTTLTEGMF